MSPSRTIPQDLAEAAGHAFARRHRRPVKPDTDVSADEAICHVIAMFTELGFEPELGPDGQHLQIRLRACPFRTIASKYPEVVCSIHLGLLRGTLAELGVPITAHKLRPFIEPHLCVAYLSPVIKPAPDAEALPTPSAGNQP